VSDEKLWDESPTSSHLQVPYHQTSFQLSILQFGLFQFGKPTTGLREKFGKPTARLN